MENIIKSMIEENYVPLEKYEKLKEECEKLKDEIKKLKEENIKIKGLQISDNSNVRYMNGNAEDISKWDIFVNNNESLLSNNESFYYLKNIKLIL